MPPNYVAQVGHLKTFTLPAQVTGGPEDLRLGKALIDAWRQDGILQVSLDKTQQRVLGDALVASKRFFGKPRAEKVACVDSQSYAGYIASGEEITAGVADYSEIFTVTKDLPLEDLRVISKWPCHGPCPWPDANMKHSMQRYMTCLGETGETLLQLIEYGLDLSPGTLTRLTRDGWHHMRILRLVYRGLELKMT
jgi:isopenicillin N synthase-like dioxygenase